MRHSIKPLTTAGLSRVKPGTTLADGLVPGLRFRSGTWILRYRHDDGARRLLKQVKLGRLPVMSLDAARVRARELKALMQAGEATPQQAVAAVKAERAEGQAAHRKQQYTMRDLLVHYGEEHLNARRSVRNAKMIVQILKRIPETLMERPAGTLRRDEAHSLVQSIEAPSIRRVLGRELRAAYNHAIDAGRTGEVNPFERMKLPAQGKRSRVLSTSELKLVLPWLDTVQGAARDAVKIALLTGMRTGEVVGARREHLSADTLLLPKTKNGEARLVMLSGRAAEILHARRIPPRVRDAEWLFPSPKNRGEPLKQRAVGQALWSRQPPTAERWTAHDMRRTCATHLAELGFADSDLVELILGHKRQGVRGVYNRSVRAEEQRIALEKWADWLDSL